MSEEGMSGMPMSEEDLLVQQGLDQALENSKPEGMSDANWNRIQKKAVSTIRLALAPEELKHLDFSGNRIAGFVENEGKEIQLRMTNLEVLDLSNNLFKNDTFAILSGLPSRKCLYMGNNQLQGSIDIKELHAWNNVEEIFLDYSYLDNNILQSIGVFTSLKTLSLSNCGLIGSLPNQVLDLSDNHLSGRIPEELIMRSLLDVLRLSNNNLSGKIVPMMFNTSMMSYLYLDDNNFAGEIPDIDLSATHFSHSSLVDIDLSNNGFNGKLPRWIGNVSHLKRLALSNNHFEDLSGNMFSDPIPSCLSNLTLVMKEEKSFVDSSKYIANTMQDLPIYVLKDLSHDYPVSNMKEWIEFTTNSVSYSYGGDILKYMSGIDLSYNRLTGQIPVELGNLSEIHSLNLSHNNLVGVIPSSFSQLKQIESLDLSYNNLSGRIPIQLVELNFLEVFNMAHNNLSGCTPEPKAQFGTFDESSYKANAFLCGPPLQNNCSKTESPSTVPTTTDNEGEENTQGRGNNEEVWKRIWSVKVPTKMRTFMWWFCHGIIQGGERPWATEAWKHLNYQWEYDNEVQQESMDSFPKMIMKLKHEQLQLFAIT
ncbi:LRR receptor-like serine/threonine-protein kinase ERL1 [Durio zibethinus]|uniref:LRR receptor-like serine/threonine-protein kinase ERL1 n=1 Tax=Durio zibethinus TaxID=66656 RepID=A0A6P5X305_DURZI|nr:LRR receptor-like serine/threonine-protein kinase ERL1 [Durio zibethinus]